MGSGMWGSVKGQGYRVWGCEYGGVRGVRVGDVGCVV